jgi:hypothetical protein
MDAAVMAFCGKLGAASKSAVHDAGFAGDCAVYATRGRDAS